MITMYACPECGVETGDVDIAVECCEDENREAGVTAENIASIDYEPQHVALSQHLEVPCSGINDIDNEHYECGRDGYLVVTDDRADKLWDAELENYIDECILPDLPESSRGYFDRESWKSDARHDGRGHSLNHYDGNEDEEAVWGETYFIFRQ